MAQVAFLLQEHGSISFHLSVKSIILSKLYGKTVLSLKKCFSSVRPEQEANSGFQYRLC